ncbi:MAG TPA: FAD-dependent oxidoreductase [Gemmatimonadales bacterium]|nr:FAD-dependent oxidoreductase [Gemmatimonadales bacterium]
MTHPDVVVIGAGVVGASVAWHLAGRGVKVTLVDQGHGRGDGSSARATGGFRAQYGTAINIRLSLLSRAKLRAFPEEVGADPGYEPAGYLWLATSPRELATLSEGCDLQRSEGVTEAAVVSTDEIRRLNPAVHDPKVIGGTWCPTDGFIRPLAILGGYLDGARARGAEVRWETRVTGVERNGEGITAVVTDRGPIPCGAVVVASGPWSGEVGRALGLAIPVQPLRRQVAPTVPTQALPSGMPMTIWAGDGFHVRVRNGRVLLLRPTEGDPRDPWSTAVDEAWVQEVTLMGRTRIPALREVAVDRLGCWAGLYEMSPDKHALLGRVHGAANAFTASGNSGHGVMHSLAEGQLLSELIVDGAFQSLDATSLRPTRFAEGAAIPGPALL